MRCVEHVALIMEKRNAWKFYLGKLERPRSDFGVDGKMTSKL
jgi:hypothetical protein